LATLPIKNGDGSIFFEGEPSPFLTSEV